MFAEAHYNLGRDMEIVLWLSVGLGVGALSLALLLFALFVFLQCRSKRHEELKRLRI